MEIKRKSVAKKSVKKKSVTTKKTVKAEAKTPKTTTVKKKPVAKKKTATKQIKAAAKPKASAAKKDHQIVISADIHHKLIALVAYHKAETRGFLPGNEHGDWHLAEQQVNDILAINQPG
ncbi:MAG: DUF2934 domain-containing protein [Gammaproteobacteria bacterium]